MNLNIYNTSIKDVNNLKDEVKLGIQITNAEEVFFVLLYDKKTDTYHFQDMFTYDVGISVGDLIGAVDYSYGVFDSEELYNKLKEDSDFLKYQLTNNSTPVELADMTIRMYRDMCSYHFSGIATDIDDANKNPLFLPFYVEVLNGIINDGINYNFKKAEKVLSTIKKEQALLADFSKTIMLYPEVETPIEAFAKSSGKSRHSSSYKGKNILYKLTDVDSEKYFDLFIPDSLDDLFGYIVNKSMFLGMHYYCCPNCNRYFAFTTDTKTKHCNRPIEIAKYDKDIGKTCHEIGRLRVNIRNIYKDDVQKLYQKHYKKANALKNTGKIPEDVFTTWSKEARLMRDLSSQGTHPIEQFKEWLETHNICE
ncbi:MAG: DUF6076 domain-containing protein [Saccharofermentans sp.]|nr:DUF6076 domain-containing protein [Saccharofermentans sp.]